MTDPREGAGRAPDALPNVLYVSCPICFRRNVILNPVAPLEYTCGCGQEWLVEVTTTSVWHITKEPQPHADPSAS
jgi:hypothetical protein